MKTLGLLAIATVVALLAPARADATSQQAYTFMNIHYNDCNDIELDFGAAITAANYIGGAGGTNFPSVSGLGTSHIVLSGATMTNPGYSQYNFTAVSHPFPSLNSCKATHNGAILGNLRAEPF
jgi:hypothetical protein